MVNRKLGRAAGAVLFCLLSPGLTPAQEPTTEELKKEIETVKEGVKAIQKDLQEIKALLQSRPGGPPASVVLDLAKSPFRGKRDARLTLVEFSDYQCPFCGKYSRETMPQLEKEYVETGKLKHVFLDLPLESIHKFAFKAAEAAHCAGEQGKYWEMRDRLFENQKALEPWAPHAEAIGLDVARFEDCMSTARSADEVRASMAQAQKAGITGTPAFFLAYTDPASSRVKTVTAFKGARPFADFKAAIDDLLAEPAKAQLEKPAAP